MSASGSGWEDLNLSKSEIRQMFYPGVYSDGARAYEKGDIKSVLMTDSYLIATFDGRDGVARVRITPDDIVGETSCVCRSAYVLWGPCLHVAAVLLHLHDHLDELLDQKLERQDSIRYHLPRIPEEDLREYIGEVLSKWPEGYEGFMDSFNLRHIPVPRNHYAVMQNVYKRALSQNADGDSVRFGLILNIARESREAGSHAEAAKAYKAMSETILENMSSVENTGYYTDCFEEAVDSMVDSIVREDMPADRKRGHIAYFFDRITSKSHAKYRAQYVEALKEICYTGEDMEYWESLLHEHIRATNASGPHLLLMTCHILKETGREKAALGLLEKHYTKHRELCLQYVMLLREYGMAAPGTVQKALAAFPKDAEILKAGLPLHDASGPEYLDVVQRLFVITGDWEHFDGIKRMAPDWEGALRRMAKMLKSSPGRVVEMYLKAGMIQNAMAAAESADDIGVYFKYAPRLGKRYPERYFEAYGIRIRKFAKSRKGEEHYKRVYEHLERARAIPVGEEMFEELMAKVRSDNRGKTLLLKAVKRLWGRGQ